MAHLPDETLHTVLLADADVVIRAPLAAYLRDCGFHVIEASGPPEAQLVLEQAKSSIDVVVCDAATVGSKASFTFSQWVRTNHPSALMLLAGSAESAAAIAGDLCENGPSLARPYHPSTVLDAIRQGLATRDRNSGT